MYISTPRRQGIVIVGISLGIGIIMAYLLVPGALHDWVFALPGVNSVYNILHLPAGALLYCGFGFDCRRMEKTYSGYFPCLR